MASTTKMVVAYMLCACLAFLSAVLTLSYVQDGRLLRKLDSLMPFDADDITDFVESFLEPEPDVEYSYDGNHTSDSGFLALRPTGSSAEYIPPEARLGHPYLRMRTYPRATRRSRCKNCFRFQHADLLTPTVCAGTPEVTLLILVTTVPDNTKERQSIRNTWGRVARTGAGQGGGSGGAVVRLVFLFGRGWSPRQQRVITDEYRQHGDLLQTDYLDSYFNLSLKVLSGFRWGARHCRQAEHVLRTADDNFVNMAALLRFLVSRQGELTDTVVGRCGEGSRPIRQPHNKWYVTFNEYPAPYYPPYCIGTAFITTRSLVSRMLKMAANVPYFVMEDVYFGLVLRELNRGRRRRAKVKDVEGFHLRLARVKPGSTRCPFKEPWFTVHEVPPVQMYLIWQVCQKG